MALKQISPVLLSGDTADKAIDAAMAGVQEVGVPYTISVVDGAGLLVAVRRMDGAAIASIDTSLAKARTAVLFGAATADLAAAATNGAPLMTIETAATVPLAFVAGGVPITDAAGVVVGAVGAGGGDPGAGPRRCHNGSRREGELIMAPRSRPAVGGFALLSIGTAFCAAGPSSVKAVKLSMRLQAPGRRIRWHRARTRHGLAAGAEAPTTAQMAMRSTSRSK